MGIVTPNSPYWNQMNGDSGSPAEEPSGSAGSGQGAWEEQKNYGGLASWVLGTDPNAHNEAVAADKRAREMAQEAFERESNFNAQAARENREWEKMMSDTAFQRKVADYQKAGFSPLAALEGAVGASSPSGTAASASYKAPGGTVGNRTSSGFGGVVSALLVAVASLASKGMSVAARAAESSGRAAQEAARIASNEKIAALRIASNEKLRSTSWAKEIAQEQEEKIRAQYFRKLEEKEIERLNKLHRNPYKR